MKKLKVTLKRQNEEQQFRKLKKMSCPCCDGTMILEDDRWCCQNCAYCITQKSMLEGAVFWFCDECGRFLNVQPSFATTTGVWKCVACGFANDVSKDNIID